MSMLPCGDEIQNKWRALPATSD